MRLVCLGRQNWRCRQIAESARSMQRESARVLERFDRESRLFLCCQSFLCVFRKEVEDSALQDFLVDICRWTCARPHIVPAMGTLLSTLPELMGSATGCKVKVFRHVADPSKCIYSYHSTSRN